jgi:hypothetical protein
MSYALSWNILKLLISVHLQHINLEIGLWSFFLKLKLEVQSNDLSPPFNFMLQGVSGGQGEDHDIHSHKIALQHTRHLLNANFSHPLKFLILSNFKSVKKEGISINTGLTYRFILSSKCMFCPKLMMFATRKAQNEVWMIDLVVVIKRSWQLLEVDSKGGEEHLGHHNCWPEPIFLNIIIPSIIPNTSTISNPDILGYQK